MKKRQDQSVKSADWSCFLGFLVRIQSLARFKIRPHKPTDTPKGLACRAKDECDYAINNRHYLANSQVRTYQLHSIYLYTILLLDP